MGALLAVVALIAYGSLYPWHFEARELPANPLWILLHATNFAAGRYELFDIAVNIALYIPLGAAGTRAVRRWRIPGVRVWGPVALGAVLSASMEMLQLFEPLRHCSAIDLATNVAGSALGVVAGLALGEYARSPARVGLVDRRAVGLAACWVGAWVFPLFPAIGRGMLRLKLSVFLHGPVLSPVALVSYALSWFVLGKLLAAAGVVRVRWWLAVSLLAIPAQLAIVTRQPVPVEVVGGAVGLAGFAAMGAMPLGWLFAALLVLRGLAPFHWSAVPTEFSWIPFGGFLAMEWQAGIALLLEKCFYYGSAIWLLGVEGWGWRRAVGAVVLVLIGIEVAQIWIVGRTPEITDPLLALVLALVVAHRF